jgi:hypothetical protein
MRKSGLHLTGVTFQRWPEGAEEIIDNINNDRRYLDRYANHVPLRCKSVALCLEPNWCAPTYTYSFWNIWICGRMPSRVCVYMHHIYEYIKKLFNTRCNQML